MSTDGKLLARARKSLDERRQRNQTELLRRTNEIYGKNPRAAALDGEIKATVMDAIGQALRKGGNPEYAVEKIGEHNIELQRELSEELMAMGYPPDYLNEIYSCPECKDRGYIRGQMCSCLRELYRQEQIKELSGLLKLGQETFDNFELDWYDDTPDRATGISPRSAMEFVYETCVEYARKFGKNSYNLLMRGGTGLGKTFLSTCIAKVVSERGFSVVYDTASSVFGKLEEEKFSKSSNIQEIQSEVRRYMSCDLLIIDDLGTEMTTSFVTSALYNLINTRLMTGKKTIISTNLTETELKARYSQQIVSRLEGEYQVLPFYGRDIRMLKKEQ